MRRGWLRLVGICVALALAFGAPAALAAGGGSATEQGYPGATTPAASGSSSNSGSTAGVAGVSNTLGKTRAGGTLPFTGAQLGMIVLAGVLLVGGGFVLRASGRDRSGV